MKDQVTLLPQSRTMFSVVIVVVRRRYVPWFNRDKTLTIMRGKLSKTVRRLQEAESYRLQVIIKILSEKIMLRRSTG